MTDKLGQRQAERDLARHEATHPGCNERYWMERAEKAEDGIAEAAKQMLAITQGQQSILAKLALVEQAAMRAVTQIERAEQAATHFFRCRECSESGPCEEGLGYARALGLVP